MNVIIVYIFFHAHLAERFANTFLQCPPEYPFTLLVVVNNSEPTDFHRNYFKQLPCVFIAGHNIGWDIGAFQDIAQDVDCDWLLCFGNSAFFRRAGWLKRMMEASAIHGKHLYGCHGTFDQRPHIRTTGFWFPPELMRSYPWKIRTHDERYFFEHGTQSFTWWAEHENMQPMVVTWEGVHPKHGWPHVPNGYHHGNQMSCLVFDNHTG